MKITEESKCLLTKLVDNLIQEFKGIKFSKDFEDAIIEKLYISYKYGKEHGWHHEQEAAFRAEVEKDYQEYVELNK